MKNILKKSVTWLMILLLSVGTMGTFLPGTSAEAEAAETETPKYMAKINPKKDDDDDYIRMGLRSVDDTKYTLCFDYLIPEDNNGVIVATFDDESQWNVCSNNTGQKQGQIGTYKLEYDYEYKNDSGNWIAFRIWQTNSSASVYIWNISITMSNSSGTETISYDFEDGTWKGWTLNKYKWAAIDNEEQSKEATAQTGHTIVPYVANWTAQATLEESIDFTYKTALTVPVNKNQTPTMEFKMSDGNKVIHTKNVTGTANSDGTYSFTYDDMLPQQMAYDITATLTVPAKSGSFTQTKIFSMKEYCKAILEDDDSSTELRNLVADLLKYGAEVQKKYGLEDSITTGLTLTGLGSNSDLSSIIGYVSQILSDTQSGNYKWKSASLVLDGRVKVRLKFTADNTTNLKVQVNNQEYSIQSLENGVYYVDIPMAAADFDKELRANFNLNSETVGVTLKYSVNTYLYNKRDTTSELDLLKSIYAYGLSAEGYWNHKNPTTTLQDNEYVDNWDL